METKILQMSALTPMAVKYQIENQTHTKIVFLDFYNELVYNSNFIVQDDELGIAVKQILKEKKQTSQNLKTPQNYVREAMHRHESNKNPSIPSEYTRKTDTEEGDLNA